MNTFNIVVRVVLVAIAIVSSGCLSVARIPVEEFVVRDSNGAIVERRVDSMVGHQAERLGAFPTMKMRWRLLKCCWTGDASFCFEVKEGDSQMTTGQRVGCFLSTVGLTIGLPFDLVVDSVCVPSDRRRHMKACNGDR